MTQGIADEWDRPAPWTATDVQRWLSLSALGLVVVLVGWFLVSDKATYDEQMDVISVAVFGVILAAVGNGFWIMQGRRAVGERTRVLLAERTASLSAVMAQGAGPARPPDDVYVAGSDSTLFHRPSCALAQGRNWTPVEHHVHESAGRVPCGVCVR